jgi:hypothetical protein
MDAALVSWSAMPLSPVVAVRKYTGVRANFRHSDTIRTRAFGVDATPMQ